MKKRKLLMIPLVLIVALFFTACSASEVSEKQVRTDLEATSNYTELNVKTTDFSVIKRQTDKETKTDLVYVSIAGENEKYTLVRNYLMTYGLYNDGWVLDSVEPYQDDQNIDQTIPLVGCEEALAELQENGLENVSSEVYDNDGTYMNKLSYTVTTPYGYMTETVQYDDFYYFNTDAFCWVYLDYATTVISEEWHINGRWHYEGGSASNMVDKVKLDFVINSFDGEKIDITYDQYALYDYLSGLGQTIHEEYKASGSGVYNVVPDSHRDYRLEFATGNTKVSLLFDRYDGVINQMYVTVIPYELKYTPAE